MGEEVLNPNEFKSEPSFKTAVGVLRPAGFKLAYVTLKPGCLT